MKLRWTWSSGIKLAVGTALVLGGAFCFWAAWQCERRFEAARQARPLQGTIELSEPGEFSYPMDVSHRTAHGLVFMAQVPAEIGAKVEAEKGDGVFLPGLDLDVRITDAQGQEVLRGDPGELWGPMPLLPDWLPAVLLFETWSLPQGRYTVTILVKKGAPLLQGVSQQLTVRYRQCGCERSGVYAGNMAGVVCLLLGLPIVLSVLWRMNKEATVSRPSPPIWPPEATV